MNKGNKNSDSHEDIKIWLSKEIALILSKDAHAISVEDSLHSIGMDSLSFVELLVSIEKNFNLKLMDTNLSKEDFSTVASLSQRIYETIHG